MPRAMLLKEKHVRAGERLQLVEREGPDALLHVLAERAALLVTPVCTAGYLLDD